VSLLRKPRRAAYEPRNAAPVLPTDGRAHGAVQSTPARASAPSPEPSGPAFVGPLESVLRYPLLALAPVVAFVLAGLLIGVLRSPVYDAEARINVGRVDVPAYTLQGVTIGNATLASSYSRALAAPEVIEKAAQQANVSVEDARESLVSSPVPGSTLIRVEAEGGSSGEAQQLANAAALALIDYVTTLNVRQQESRSLERFRDAQATAEKARTRLLRIQDDRPNSPAAERARIDLRTAELHARSVGGRVLGATVAPPPENLLQLVVPAATADSDRSSVLQQALLIALVAGIVLGFALALLRANWQLVREALAR
jgi:capsular polysaccharide biosynthesis protein